MSHSTSGALEAFYGGYQQVLGGYSGGYEGGNVLDTSTGTGFKSAAKKQLIRDLRDALVKLGMDQFKGVDDVDEVLKLMRKFVPDPRKGKGNGLSWGKDKASQIKICKTVAAAINERAPGLVNVKASPDILCNQISEVVYDLFGGLSAELLMSRESLEKALKNLRSLKKFLDDNFKHIEGKIRADGDSTLGAETSAGRAIHHELLDEVDRHLAKLQMMIDTIVQPSEVELHELEQDNEEFSKRIRKITKDFGTREAGRRVSYTLSGFVTAVEAARIVDKALAKIGLSIKEYADAKEFKDLKELLSSKDLEALSKDEVSLDLYEKAKQDLLKLHYLHEDVVESLKGKSGGMFNPIEGGEDGGMFNPIDGGMFNPIDGGNVVGGLKLDKRVKRRQDLKKALVADFNNRLAQLIDIVLGASKHIATTLSDGKTEMSDTVSKFVKALESLPSLQNQYTYFCLTGAVDDIRAREEREKFISSSKYIISTIDDLLKENKSGHLKDMRDAFQRIIELIQAYVAKFAEGFGPLESWESYHKELKTGADEGVDGAGPVGDWLWGKKSDDATEMAAREDKKNSQRAFISTAFTAVADAGTKLLNNASKSSSKTGAAESFLGGAATASVARIASSLDDAIATITYFNRIAVMRRGLDKASKEFKSYKDDYIKILADSVAAKRDDNTKSKKAFVAKFDKVDAAGNAGALYADFTAGATVAQKASDDESFEKAKVLGVGMYDAVDNMYKVAEAMDIYMKEFTDGISANPDDVQSIVQILDSTEIISKWYDEKSGDLVCRVFDSFPGFYENGTAKFNNLNVDKNNIKDAHYYLRVASLLNIGSPSKIEKQGHSKVLGLTPAHIAVGDFTGWYDAKYTPPQRIAALNVNLPGNPYLATLAQFNHAAVANDNKQHSGVAALENAQKALKQVSSLKNFVSAFVSIGEKFGGKDIMSKTHMSPKLILQYLNDYIAYSAFKLGLSSAPAAIAAGAGIGAVAGPAVGGVGTFYLNTNTRTNDAYLSKKPVNLGQANSTVNDADDNMTVGLPAVGVTQTDAHLSVMMRSPEMSNIMTDDIFKTSDRLFQLVIKSMTSKILTVIGTFNMFNRPINKNGLGYYSDLRLILGGAEHPTVIPDAFELYIRLPLLAEFYRKIFNFEDTSVGDRSISMIPEMDGTFSELIALIFDKARNVNDGNYSDTETRMLVEIINKIYARFKNSKSPIRDCIEEFIAEVNRRYGIVKHDERARYLKERNERYNSKYTQSEEIVDYELKSIDEDDTFVRPSPSDQYRTEMPNIANGKGHKYSIELDTDQKMLSGLRKKIDEALKHCTEKVKSSNSLQKLRNLSFQTMLNARGHELKHATSDRHRYDIVRNAIASLGTFAVSSLERSYLLFHDTVISGLSALRLLYKNLKQYETSVYDIWYNYNTLNEFIKAQKEPAVNFAGVLGVVPGLGAAGIKDYAILAGVVAVLADTQGTDAATINAQAANRLIDLYAPTAAGAARGAALNLGQIQALPDKEKVADAYLRFSLDQKEMFADLFEAIYNHGENLSDLVEIKLDVSRNEDKETPGPPAKYRYGERKMAVHLDYSKLRERVYSLFNSVKGMFDKFRGLLPDKVLERYEKFDPDNQEPSTLYELEKRLIDELIEGRYSTDVDPDVLKKNRTLDGTNRKIKDVLDYFTRGWKVSGLMVAHGIYNNPIEQHGANTRNFEEITLHQFTDGLYDIIYNPNNPAPPAQTLFAGVPANGLMRLLWNTSGKAKLGVAAAPAAGSSWRDVSTGYLNCISTEPSKWTNNHKDLVLSFNKLVSAYLVQVYDEASRTVYLPAINKFIAGSFSSAIMGGKNYEDTAYRRVISFNTAQAQSILFRSLAIAVRQLATEKNVTGAELEFAKADLNLIPTYVKERLRANLPVFQKLFTLLQRRAELTKKFVVALDVEQQDTIGAIAPLNNKEVESTLLNTLDQVSYGCQAIMQCISDVTQDLADAPRYLETHSDFIQEYENMNGFTPFMPHASLLQVLQNTAAWDFGMPIDYLGSDNFKLLYGTRGLLIKPTHTLAETPSMLKTLKDHNNTADQRHHFVEKDLQSFSNDYVQIVKYIADARLYKQQFTLESIPLPLGGAAAGAAVVPRLHLRQDAVTGSNWVFQLMNQNGNTSLADTLRLTESNFQREERNKIVKHVEQGDDKYVMITGTRDELIACNIIDLNIVPINLHALMREMPMVNLYNYAYTYDRMVEDVLEQRNLESVIGGLPAGNPLTINSVDNKADVLLAVLLQNPYQPIDEPTYEFLVSKIMRGGMGIEGLGRPKYLGDELFNKALFGEIYSNRPDSWEGDDEHRKYTTNQIEPDAGLAGARNEGAIARNLDILQKALTAQLVGLNDIRSQLNEYLVKNRWGIPNPKVVVKGITRDEQRASINRALFGNTNNAILVDAVMTHGGLGAGIAGLAAATRTAVENLLLDFYMNNGRGVSRVARNKLDGLAKESDLHFIEKGANGKAVVRAVDVKDYKLLLKGYGKMRFDTNFVRNVFWIGNIQRLLRLKLRRDLTWYNTKVVSDHAVVASGITELYDHDVAVNPDMYNYKY